MPEGRIRHMYPGGNTPEGFFSYYDHIIPVSEAKRIYILKGGPGTGKSTLMKKIGLEYSKKGYDVEFMHCSTDSNSLDGVVIPQLKTAMVDGTAPHMRDPVFPGAVDEIINLGQFWDEKGFENSRDEIIKLSKKKKECFECAYSYLKAASILRKDIKSIYNKALNPGRKTFLVKELAEKIFREYPLSDKHGKQRNMFASAITAKGFTDFLDSITSDTEVIRLSAPVGSNTSDIIDTLKKEAIQRGFYTESFFCPMDPEKIEHLVIPELKLSLVTANVYHDVGNIDNCTTYFINDLYNEDIIAGYNNRLSFNNNHAEILMRQALNCLAEAKKYHDEIEMHYVKKMDFDSITKLRERITEKILSA